MMYPTISIIIPVYNVEPYLERCVDSILAQTSKDFELIMVDDGSTDGCGKICDNYAKMDSRIKVIHQNNGGLSAARNTGLNHATGEYVYFVDSDDFVSPVLLEKCLEVIDGYDMVAFNYQPVDEKGEAVEGPSNFELIGSLRWNSEEEKSCYLMKTFFHYKYLGWSACMRLLRRNIIERNNIRFADNNKIYAEDMFFSYCYELHCNSIVCIEDVLYYYTQRSGSIMDEQKTNEILNLNRLNELSKALNNHLVSCEGLEVMKKRFPLAHLNIINHAFNRIQGDEGQMNVFRKREAILENILDIDYFNKQTKGIINNKKDLKKIFGLIGSLRVLRDWRYYLTGNKFFYQLRRVIIFFAKSGKKLGIVTSCL